MKISSSLRSMHDTILNLYKRLNIPINEPIEGISYVFLVNEIEKRIGADPRTIEKYLILFKKYKLVVEKKGDNGVPNPYWLKINPPTTFLGSSFRKPLDDFIKKEKGEK